MATQTTTEVGYVLKIQDYLAYLDGLPSVRINDLVETDKGVRGTVAALYSDKVEVWILDEEPVSPGQLFKKTEGELSITVGDYLLGRAINPLGVAIDGKAPLSRTRGTSLSLYQEAPSMDRRKFIDTQLITGITLVDTLVPIGKGQRQLILGDAYSGKTDFLIDLLVNQSKIGTICIYASIGKPITQVRDMIDILQVTGALNSSVILAASSTESPPLIYYTPYAAMTVAEYFQKQGKDVLVVLDDLGTHAKVYRELSLLAGRSPGRQSYPGDIFYTHARLVERAGSFNQKNGGGSITALPVLELNLNDFTGFIPTNLMGMTDGHVLFLDELYGQGFRPAVDVAVSVSRVGRQTQNRLQNALSQILKQILSEAKELETLSRFSGELPPQTQNILRFKGVIDELMKQEPLTLIPYEAQIVMLALLFTNFLKDKNSDFIKVNKPKVIQFLLTDRTSLALYKNFKNIKDLNELIKILERDVAPKLIKLCQ